MSFASIVASITFRLYLCAAFISSIFIWFYSVTNSSISTNLQSDPRIIVSVSMISACARYSVMNYVYFVNLEYYHIACLSRWLCTSQISFVFISVLTALKGSFIHILFFITIRSLLIILVLVIMIISLFILFSLLKLRSLVDAILPILII